MTVSEQTYLQVALEDPEGKWELHCGQLRSKPSMTWEHVRISSLLGYQLQRQLPLDQFIVVEQSGQARRSATHYYVPDVSVVPTAMARRLFPAPGTLAVFSEPLPLIVEVWSPSTGDYDVTDKLPEYQRRGDQEIWLLHPYDRTLTAWVRGPEGSYTATVYRGGIIRPAFLPEVAIDLDELFEQ